MMTLDDALLHLGYDEIDETITKRVTRELAEAEAFLQGAVGADVFDLMPEDPRVDTLLKAYLDDIHDGRGTTHTKQFHALRGLITSTEWQLKLELVRIRESSEV